MRHVLKVFFGSGADADALAEQLLRQRDEIASELETLREIDRRKEGRSRRADALPEPHARLGSRDRPDELEWIDRALEHIAARRRVETRRTAAKSRAATLAGRDG
jgi:hypothetical protein